MPQQTKPYRSTSSSTSKTQPKSQILQESLLSVTEAYNRSPSSKTQQETTCSKLKFKIPVDSICYLCFFFKIWKKQLSLSSLHFGWHEGNNYSLFLEFKFFFPFEISRYVIILDLANCTPLLLSSPSKSFLSRPAQVLLINNTHVTLLKFLKSHLIFNFPETT